MKMQVEPRPPRKGHVCSQCVAWYLLTAVALDNNIRRNVEVNACKRGSWDANSSSAASVAYRRGDEARQLVAAAISVPARTRATGREQ